jgi:hypothetical protein
MTIIYTLELTNGKYYIGKSNLPNKRILDHFYEKGSKWTKLYKPIKVISQIKGDSFDEEKYTLLAMDKYGIENVRGGSYCNIKLTQSDRDKALQTICSIMDKCYKCGKNGHFAVNCINNKDGCDEVDNKKEYIKYETDGDGQKYCKTCNSYLSIDDDDQFDWSDENGYYCCNCDQSYCEKCGMHYSSKIKHVNFDDIDKYIRIKLGQKIFPTPYLKTCKNRIAHQKISDYWIDCEKCDNCKYNEWYNNVWKKEGHLRFDYDAKHDISHNKNIIELFSEDFINKRIVIHSWKGDIVTYIISKLSYDKYDYWEGDCSANYIDYPYELKSTFTGESTVEIIKSLIFICYNQANVDICY